MHITHALFASISAFSLVASPALASEHATGTRGEIKGMRKEFREEHRANQKTQRECEKTALQAYKNAKKAAEDAMKAARLSNQNAFETAMDACKGKKGTDMKSCRLNANKARLAGLKKAMTTSGDTLKSAWQTYSTAKLACLK